VALFLIQIIDLAVTILTILIIVYSLMSFMPLDPWHPVRRTLTEIVEPILRPFRNLIPPVGMMDFSPLVALIVIQLLGQLLKIVIQSAF
jgi:YggT family protein